MANVRDTLRANTLPTATDDYDAGFREGSEWFHVPSAGFYKCIDETPDAAVWVEMNPESRYWPEGGEFGPEYAIATSNALINPNTLEMIPWTFERRMIVDKVSVNLTTAGTAGAVAQFALYRNNPAVFDGVILVETAPGALPLDGSPGRIGIDNLGWDVMPGNYLIASLFNSNTTNPTVTMITGTNRGGVVPRAEAGDQTSSVFRRSVARTYSLGFPATATIAASAGGQSPLIQLLKGA